MQMNSRLGEWQTYCIDVVSNQSIAFWTENAEQPMTRDVRGQLIWVPSMRNISRIEVAGSSAVFTNIKAFKLKSSPYFPFAPNDLPTSNIFGWNSTQWNLDRQYIQQVRKDKVFTTAKASLDKYYYDFPAPVKLTFNQSVSMCYRLGGQLPDFPSLTSWQSAYDTHRESLPDKSLWLPYIKAKDTDNGTVTNFYTGEYLGTAGNVPWRQGEPSRPDSTCVLCNRAGCGSYVCTIITAFLCRIPLDGVGRPLLHLQGLCTGTGLDIIYYPQLQPKEAANYSVVGGLDLVWTGLSRGTYIHYNSSTLVWEARRKGRQVTATSEASKKSFLVGTRQWTVELDTDCSSSSSQLLSLNACTKDQFNCDDGSCIDLEYR